MLQATSLFVAIGPNAQALIEEFCQVSGIAAPAMESMRLEAGEALAWRPRVADARPFRLNIAAAAKPGGVGVGAMPSGGVPAPGTPAVAAKRTAGSKD
jgi:hypothetical protein